ncbi:MAG: hypothetical protein IMZ44_07555 [Planctomycetes bacterium]|nr:hypothetical protein [Planctomycetota bacterium]
MSLLAHQKKLELAGDNYAQTVMALCAFANEILFDDDLRKPHASGSVHCGRRFTTSHANRHSRNTDVTPDLAVLGPADYRVIAEAKLGFDSDPKKFAARVQEVVEQIEKYDDDLVGWPGTHKPSGKPPNHDLAVLVNFEDAKRLARELKNRRTSGTFCVNRAFAIVSIVRVTRATGEWPTLTLEDGALSDVAKTAKLETRIPINPAHLNANPHIGLVKMYDCPPPLPTMMLLIYKAIIDNLTLDELEQYNLETRVEKAVTLADLQAWVSAYAFKKHDLRDPTLPEVEWLAKAIRVLLKMGWLARKLGGKDTFIYCHKKGRKGAAKPYMRFVEVCAKEMELDEERARKKQKKDSAREKRRIEKYKEEHPLLAPLVGKDESQPSPPRPNAPE